MVNSAPAPSSPFTLSGVLSSSAAAIVPAASLKKLEISAAFKRVVPIKPASMVKEISTVAVAPDANSSKVKLPPPLSVTTPVLAVPSNTSTLIKPVGI